MSISKSSEAFDSHGEYKQKSKEYLIRKNKKYYFYNLYLSIVILLPVLSVGFVNWLIDPQDVFNTPNYLGINNVKPTKDRNDRLFKAIDITRIKPKTIIVGSSRTKQGINPEHPIFDSSSGVYNLAINGPNFYEVRRYVEHAIYNQPDLKKIVLGIDFFMFNANLDNQPTFNESRLEQSHLTLDDGIKALFSLDSLSNSKDTIAASKEAESKNDLYGENGFMPNRNRAKSENIWRFNQSIKLYFQLHSDYKFSEKYWSDFAKIVTLCQQNNIELTVFISPAHATQWKSIELTNRWEIFENWKRKLVKLTPAWDFSGYNSITTESISNNMNNYVDNSHYTPEIGNLIINRIFNYQLSKVPQDFGVLLTEDNVEEHLNNIRKQEQQWKSNNSKEVELVEKIFIQNNNVNKTK